MSTSLTPLELDLLGRFYTRYKQYGFPAVASFRVKSRETSCAGRFTYLENDGYMSDYDGDLGLGKYSQFEMDGVRYGFSFSVQLKDGKVDFLEFVVNGDEEWDGSESDWRVLNPDTGERPS